MRNPVDGRSERRGDAVGKEAYIPEVSPDPRGGCTDKKSMDHRASWLRLEDPRACQVQNAIWPGNDGRPKVALVIGGQCRNTQIPAAKQVKGSFPQDRKRRKESSQSLAPLKLPPRVANRDVTLRQAPERSKGPRSTRSLEMSRISIIQALAEERTTLMQNFISHSAGTKALLGIAG